MEKKEYLNATMEIVVFSQQDVIATSGNETDIDVNNLSLGIGNE